LCQTLGPKLVLDQRALVGDLPDQHALTPLEAEDRLLVPMVDAIQRAAELLEEIGWAAGRHFDAVMQLSQAGAKSRGTRV
jgi:hypothetical protein